MPTKPETTLSQTAPPGDAMQHNDHGERLTRGLSNRHIQLIAIGGAIGTGLFLGSGKTISVAGPSVIFVYMIIGFMLFFVMRAMGEVLLSNSGYRNFADFAGDLIGPWAGFMVGWTYWFCWIIIGIADLIAISGYVAVWAPGLPLWVPALLTIGLFLLLNLVAVRLFGELEFWFALIKVVAIVALVVTGVVLIAIAFRSPNGDVASLANLWNDGGMFPKGFMGFIGGFQIAIFAFQGIELAGTAAAETKSPEKTLPKAINSIPVRVLLFYVCSLIVIMAVTPWHYASSDKSPFVEMFALAGLAGAAGVVNFVVLTSAASSANSGIFSTSRIMYGMAGDGEAPETFNKLSKNHVPARALMLSCVCLLPGVILLYAGDSVGQAFTLVTSISAILFITVWGFIVVAYLAYRKKHPERHAESKFKMPGGKVMAWVVLVFFALVIVALGFAEDTRIALYAAPVWYLIMIATYFGLVRRAKRRLVKPAQDKSAA
ncbi:D-serine/D-alanine/glycine transporter [Psychromicrobium silvestre]|uniref:D-serine/D-alanine/glycine transporter n=2 Tax=Psychromicrobium silvestre TaxID=1645614 RepID=A0A7Y9LRI8_9MICC|nr:D-serine/D-alanine/glycine transporter [Psychromicrobium silvestre]